MNLLLHRRNRSRLNQGMVWALIPLALWGGRPVSGCICDDGHFELVCKAPVSAGDAHAFIKGDVAPSDLGSERSCCRHAVRVETPAKSCCGSKHHAPSQVPSREGIACTSDSGCQPAHRPDILLSRASDLESHRQVAAVVATVVEQPSLRATETVALNDSGGATGAERIVVLRRLVL
jgi:hypothetical protein